MTLTNRRVWFQVGAVVTVLALALLAALMLGGTRPGEAKAVRPTPAPMVEAMRVDSRDATVRIVGQGTVRPRSEVPVVPEVAGRVIALHPQLVSGGHFEADEPLVQIDPRDYELDIVRAEARRDEAHSTEAATEAAVAEAEARLSDGRQDADRIRQLRERDVSSRQELDRAESALQQAEARLRSARAQHAASKATLAVARSELDRARLDLERTTVSLPFDGHVISKDVSVGQQLSPHQTVALVYDRSQLEVPIPLEDRDLAWFDIGEADGAAVTLAADFAGRRLTWEGRAVRREARVDPQTRMVNVIVQLTDATEGPHDTPLPTPLPGMFLEATIEGRTLADIVAVPMDAVHPGGRIWIAGDEGRLEKRDIELAWRDHEHAYLRSGVAPGERVVLGAMDTALEGVLVRVREVAKPASPAGVHE